MAYDNTKLAKLAELEMMAERIKGEIEKAGLGAADALRSGKQEGNTLNFYTSADGSGAPAVVFNLPAEMFLDQARTKFEKDFAWSAGTYPGSEDPSIDGKPVMTLAVKGDDGSVSFSFLDMSALVDTYKPKGGGKDASTTVTVAGYEIDVKVNISQEAGNQLQMKADGLYVPKPEAVNVTGKADKVQGATEGDLATLDASGNLVDSGKKPSDFSKVAAGSAAGKIKVDGADVTVVELATDAEVGEMLDSVFGAAG